MFCRWAVGCSWSTGSFVFVIFVVKSELDNCLHRFILWICNKTTSTKLENFMWNNWTNFIIVYLLTIQKLSNGSVSAYVQCHFFSRGDNGWKLDYMKKWLEPFGSLYLVILLPFCIVISADIANRLKSICVTVWFEIYEHLFIKL
jgi:hypothetical protein